MFRHLRKLKETEKNKSKKTQKPHRNQRQLQGAKEQFLKNYYYQKDDTPYCNQKTKPKCSKIGTFRALS